MFPKSTNTVYTPCSGKACKKHYFIKTLTPRPTLSRLEHKNHMVLLDRANCRKHNILTRNISKSGMLTLVAMCPDAPYFINLLSLRYMNSQRYEPSVPILRVMPIHWNTVTNTMPITTSFCSQKENNISVLV